MLTRYWLCISFSSTFSNNLLPSAMNQHCLNKRSQQAIDTPNTNKKTTKKNESDSIPNKIEHQVLWCYALLCLSIGSYLILIGRSTGLFGGIHILSTAIGALIVDFYHIGYSQEYGAEGNKCDEDNENESITKPTDKMQKIE